MKPHYTLHYTLPIIDLDTIMEVTGRTKQDNYSDRIIQQMADENSHLAEYLGVIIRMSEDAYINLDTSFPRKVCCIAYDALRMQASKQGTWFPLVSLRATKLADLEVERQGNERYSDISFDRIEKYNPLLLKKIMDYCCDYSKEPELGVSAVTFMRIHDALLFQSIINGKKS